VRNKKVIIARHGQTELNRVGIIQGSGVDPSLNEEGRLQALALHRVLQGTIDLVGSSGMLRANETAKPFIDEGIRSFEDGGFREISWGEYEGRVARGEMRKVYQSLIQNWESGNFDARIPGGESAYELSMRLQQSWKELIQKQFETALIIMHGRALRCLACWLDGNSISQMNQYTHSNCGYYVVEIHDENNWAVTAQNVTEHLVNPEIFHK